MLYILSQEETARTRFIFELFFSELLGVEYMVVKGTQEVPENAPLLNYTRENVPNAYQVMPSDLLFQTGVSETIKLEKTKQNQLKLVSEDHFDPFASGFYLVSRYEEYQPYEKDVHKRFPSTASVLFQTGLLQEPLVNLWALDLDKALKDKFNTYQSHPRNFEYLSTIDIDQAWKYRHKGIRRNIGGFFSDLLKKDFFKVRERLKVMSRIMRDPFDNFGYQKKLHDRYGFKPSYFVEVGERSQYDKNLPASNRSFARLIVQLDKQGNVGMHPSYTSNDNPRELREEYEQLCSVLDREVTISRQHFLMHQMPDTYRNLIQLGIREDHTMGYSTELGFRAGIAAPFHFFDLEKNERTELVLYPFCMMDITPMHYYQLSIEDSVNLIKKQVQIVRNCGGMYISLWHNESLSDAELWKGWRKLYESILEEASDSGKAG